MKLNNYIVQLLLSMDVFNLCFCFLVGVLIGSGSFVVGLKLPAINAWIKMYKLIIKKKTKKHDEIVLSGKTKLSNIEVSIYNVLIDSEMRHYKIG